MGIRSKPASKMGWIVLMLLGYRLGVISIFAYAVFWLGFSGWWFLLALIFLALGLSIE